MYYLVPGQWPASSVRSCGFPLSPGSCGFPVGPESASCGLPEQDAYTAVDVPAAAAANSTINAPAAIDVEIANLDSSFIVPK